MPSENTDPNLLEPNKLSQSDQAKVDAFQPTLSRILEEANCGGLVTLENIRVIRYLADHSG